jgi:hypothetical protein
MAAAPPVTIATLPPSSSATERTGMVMAHFGVKPFFS